MNLTVIPYILIIFFVFFFFFKIPDADIFFWRRGGVIFIFMFHTFAWFIWYSQSSQFMYFSKCDEAPNAVFNFYLLKYIN